MGLKGKGECKNEVEEFSECENLEVTRAEWKRLNDGEDLNKNVNVFCKPYTLWHKQMAGGIINKHWWTWL